MKTAIVYTLAEKKLVGGFFPGKVFRFERKLLVGNPFEEGKWGSNLDEVKERGRT